MPVVDRQKERQIVERAIQRGMSKDQIKQAVITFRAQGTGQQTEQPQQGRQASPLERAILSFGDAQGREKFIQERNIGQVNKQGLDIGDITALAGKALPVAFGTAASIPSVGAGAIVGSPGGPAGILAGAAGLGAAGGALGQSAGENVRQVIGKALGVAEQKNLPEIVREAKIGAIGGLLDPIFGPLFGRIASKIKRTPQNLLEKILRPTPGEAVKGSAVVPEFKNVKGILSGTLSEMESKASTLSNQLQKQRDEIIKKAKGQIDALDAIVPLDKLRSEFLDAGNSGAAKTIENIQDTFIERIAKKTKGTGIMTIQDAQALKKSIQKVLNVSDFGAESGPLKEAQKTVQRELKEALEKKVDGIGIINKQISELSKFANLAKKAGKKKTQFGNIVDIIMGTAGTSIGGTVGTAIGGIPGGASGGIAGFIAGAGIPRAFRSSLIRATRARAISPLSNILEKIPKQGLDAGSSAIIRGLLQKTREKL